MKKYIIFIGVFVFVYIVVEILSGVMITSMYTPSLSQLEGAVSQGVKFGQYSMMPLLSGIFASTLAFFVYNKLFKQKGMN